MNLIGLMAAIGAMFGGLAAFTAFLITYGEYRRHRLGVRRTLRISLSMAMVAFFFFLLSAVVIGLIMSGQPPS